MPDRAMEETGAPGEGRPRSERFERGLEMRQAVLGKEYVAKSLAAADDFSWPMQVFATEVCWDQVWNRPGLDKRSRSLLNLGMIAALNRPHELKLHIRGALNNGVTRDELSEIFLQVAAYCGTPAGLDSFRLAREVLAEMDAMPGSLIRAGDWPGFELATVQGQECPLAVRVAGPADAPTVLFSHSILTSSAIWHRQAALLLDRGFRVLCVDTRGHGASEAPSGPYPMDDLVADVVLVLDALGVERVHHVGVSQGGMTGLGLAVLAPERLASLCVVAARGDAPPEFADAWEERIALVERDWSVEGLAMPTAERWLGRDFLSSHPELARDLLTCIRGTSPEGFIGCALAIQELAYIHEVPALDVPVAMIVGEADPLRPTMHELASTIEGANVTEIAGAGHLPQLDRPEEFDAALLRHLARAAPSSVGEDTQRLGTRSRR